MTSNSVEVEVEAVIENQIEEVTLDGQELYTPQLSMSEQLTKLAHKIDFYNDENDKSGKPISEGEKPLTESKEVVKFQPSLWPWDSVRNKLKAAFTEMSVLCDLLKIAKEKRYMLLDQISGDNTDTKVSVHLISKKKALTAGASIITNGADRIRNLQVSGNSNLNMPDFHTELTKLRQNWRLRKVGNNIIGDLTHKSAGSRFQHSGSFEVLKCDTEGKSISGDVPRCALQVVVPSELEGVAYIQVEVMSTSEGRDLASACLQSPSIIGANLPPPDAYWQQKLEAAQNVIFCKELFSQLAREAVLIKSSVPHIVVGNQLFTNIFPGVQLSIVLCHYTGKSNMEPTAEKKPDHNHVLEHSLHQMLREMHHRQSFLPVPHPASAMLGMTRKRRCAGPQAYSIRDLAGLSESQGILERIVAQAKHTVLRKRTMDTIDSLAKQFSDPQIICHWMTLNSSLETSVKVIILSAGYENISCRTSCVVVVGIDKVRVICRDCRVCNLSYEQKELYDFLLLQIQQHFIITAHSLSKLLSWQCLASNLASGVGQPEISGTRASILLVPPNGNKLLSVISSHSGVKVSIKTLSYNINTNESEPNDVVTNRKWNLLDSDFVPVDLQKINGRNFVHKLELLMACLLKQAV